MPESTITKENIHKYKIGDYDDEAAMLVLQRIALFEP